QAVDQLGDAAQRGPVQGGQIELEPWLAKLPGQRGFVEIDGRAGEDHLDLGALTGNRRVEGLAGLQRRLPLELNGPGRGGVLGATVPDGQRLAGGGHLLRMACGGEQGLPGSQRSTGRGGRPAATGGAGGQDDQRRGGQAGARGAARNRPARPWENGWPPAAG